MRLKAFTGIFLLFISCSGLQAQEHDPDHRTGESHEFKRHRIALIIGHGHVFGAENIDNKKNIITIPTWGLDYQYWVNPKFGCGLKSDMEIMEYLVKTDNGTLLERQNPLIISTVFLYHPARGWNFLIGPGIEFEEEHNFFVVRTGVAYEFELGNHWDFSPELIFDLKNGSIGAITWGIGVGKRF